MNRLVAIIALALLTGACAIEPKSYVVLLDEDGKTGKVDITVDGETRTLEQANTALGLEPGIERSRVAYQVDGEKVRRDFGNALDGMPEKPVTFRLYFEFGGAELTPESQGRIPKILDVIKQRQSLPDISISGHTDRVGDAEYNLKIGLDRALEVKDIIERAFREAGMTLPAIEVVSHGEGNPVIATRDGISEPRNRRVDATVR